MNKWKTKRNRKIYRRVKNGETQVAVAADFDMTPQRVGQIVAEEDQRRCNQPMTAVVPEAELNPVPEVDRYDLGFKSGFITGMKLAQMGFRI
jgi:hypothetical protein